MIGVFFSPGLLLFQRSGSGMFLNYLKVVVVVGEQWKRHKQRDKKKVLMQKVLCPWCVSLQPLDQTQKSLDRTESQHHRLTDGWVKTCRQCAMHVTLWTRIRAICVGIDLSSEVKVRILTLTQIHFWHVALILHACSFRRKILQGIYSAKPPDVLEASCKWG